VEYLVQCWNCLGDFDAVGAVWCGCSSQRPTKICPFCLQCFCAADPVYQQAFWESAPHVLQEELQTLGQARQRLGDILVNEGVISADQLLQALKRQKETGQLLGEALVSLGAVSQEDLDEVLGRQRATPTADLKAFSLHPELVQEVGVDLCYDKAVLPMEKDRLRGRHVLTVAMADPSDRKTIRFMERRTACHVIAEVADREEILEILQNAFPRVSEGDEGIPSSREMRQVLLDWVAVAVRRGATHIHLESQRFELCILLRIDGVMYRVKRYPKKLLPYILREVRRLVNQPPGEAFARGRVSLKVAGHRYLAGIRMTRTDHGEGVSVRLVDPEAFGADLKDSVPDPTMRGLMAGALGKPGLVLICSPIYHGRNETLYALLRTEQAAGRRPILLERHLLCPLKEVPQDELEPDAVAERLSALSGEDSHGAIFLGDLLAPGNLGAVLDAAGERCVVASLRAQGVVQALTALLDAAGAGALAARLTAITNQRQVRAVCPSCRVADDVERSVAVLRLDEEEARGFQPVRGAGCQACHDTGYRGRMILFEAIPFDEAIRGFLDMGTAPEVLYKQAADRGAPTLRNSFLDAVRTGHVSVAEFEKIRF
jgi:type IV pilus assembly protein PilB